MKGGTGLTLPCLAQIVDRPKDVASSSVDNSVGVLLDDREVTLNLGQAVIRQLVGLLDIWLGIPIWLLQIWLDWLAEAGVCTVCELKRSLSIRVRLVCLDAIVDDRVGVEVGEEFGRVGWLVAVGERLRCVRHLGGGCFCLGLCCEIYRGHGQIELEMVLAVV